MLVHPAISARERKQPRQISDSSSVQMLMQGEIGPATVMAGGGPGLRALNYGGASPILQTASNSAIFR
jgi:hypothetical protein